MEKDLLAWHQEGFIPGPNESREDFKNRVEITRQSFEKLSHQAIPQSHWDFSRVLLKNIFDFSPGCLPAFYSNHSLMPWQGAATWVENGRISSVQLRESFRKGTFFGLICREEILAHEAVHAARSAFLNDPWEEFFAYMTSDKAWRRILGPIVRRPWELWPFLFFCLLGPIFNVAFLGASLWAILGFWRLGRGHYILKKASHNLQKLIQNPQHVRAILLRLTGDEIEGFARGENMIALKEKDYSLRWQIIRLLYLYHL